MSVSEDDANRAFMTLRELFSHPIKNAQKPFRRYDLEFEGGEPLFTLSEADEIFDAYWPTTV